MTAPGWYPDGQGKSRYWDGQGWTEQTTPPFGQSGIAPPPAYGPPQGHRTPSQRHVGRNIALGAVAFLGVVAIITAIAGGKKNNPTPVAATSLPNLAVTTALPAQVTTDATTVVAPPPAPTTTAAPTTLLNLTGSGAKNTADFTAPDEWVINYTYDCSNFAAGTGNFAITVAGTDGSPKDLPVNELGAKGASSSTVHGGGAVYLEINSECDWHIRVTTI